MKADKEVVENIGFLYQCHEIRTVKYALLSSMLVFLRSKRIKQFYFPRNDKTGKVTKLSCSKLAIICVFLSFIFFSNVAFGFERNTTSNEQSVSDSLSRTTTTDNISGVVTHTKAMNRPSTWWLAKSYFSGSKPPDIVILGDSQLGALFGADTYVYNNFIDITGDRRSQVLESDLHVLLNKNWQVFIGGIPGAMISDQLIISRVLFVEPYKPKLVVLGISPRDFINSACRDDTLSETSAFFSRYINRPSILIEMLRGDNKEKFCYRKIPDNTPGHGLSLTLGKPFELICPGELVISPGDNYLFLDDTNQYKARYKAPFSAQFKSQMQCFDALLSYLAKQNIKVVVFDMPLTASNRHLLAPDFRQSYTDQIIELCKKHEADFIDINNDWRAFTDADFIDGVHLNLHGGLKLTRPMALFIANKFHWKTFDELRHDEQKMF